MQKIQNKVMLITYPDSLGGDLHALDTVLERYANFNMNFCLYYSCGYTYDTDEFCMLTSRSPAYYVSSAFWSRDCFLWAFPGILYADAAIARKILLTGFSRYINNIGIHALYIDGRVLYPGFELDELVAPVIALERYVSFTGDCDIMHLPAVKHGLECIREELARHFSPGLGLYSTELDPSDDPAEYRYLTYDNVLCAKALEFLGAEDEARAVRAAIGRHCVTEIGGDRIYAWGTDGDGQTAYDDPPGSLLLLPFYGFCDRDDPVYVRTAECIFSDSNPNFYKNGSLFGTGCDHTPFPWPVSLINLLLGRGYGSDAVASLRIMAEAAPLACESVNPVDGGLNTGDAFATMAGFLAAGIFDSL